MVVVEIKNNLCLIYILVVTEYWVMVRYVLWLFILQIRSVLCGGLYGSEMGQLISGYILNCGKTIRDIGVLVRV